MGTGHDTGRPFSRLTCPVVFFRGVDEDDALFNFTFADEFGRPPARIHGNVWAHCCDDLRFVECGCNHLCAGWGFRSLPNVLTHCSQQHAVVGGL